MKNKQNLNLGLYYAAKLLTLGLCRYLATQPSTQQCVGNSEFWGIAHL